MLKIFYIHGFNSAGNSRTVQLLHTAFPDAKVISFGYPLYDPTKTLNVLFYDITREVENLKFDNELIVVGTSTGGFWAELIHRVFNLKTVLINPARHPSIQLERHVGGNKNFVTGRTEFFTKEALVKYKTMEDLREIYEPLVPIVCISFLGDELIDAMQTTKEVSSFCKAIMSGGGQHRISENELHFVVSAINELKNTKII